MAVNGSHEEESISVVDEDSNISPDQGPYGEIGLPEFHMYTGRGAKDEEASHYALNLSCQVLQKKNRELEQQVAKLQRENNKIKKKGIPSKGSTDALNALEKDSMSLSPSNSSGFRSRGVSPGSAAANLLDNGDPTLKAQEEFVQFLQSQLDRCDSEKRDLAAQLEAEKNKNELSEENQFKVLQERDDLLRTLANKSAEFDSCRQENERLKSRCAQQKTQLEEAQSLNTSLASLKQKSRQYESAAARLESENSQMQQLYEESVSRVEELEKMYSEQKAKSRDLTLELVEKHRELEKAKKANSEMIVDRKQLEQLNEFYQTKLDRERQEHDNARSRVVTSHNTTSVYDNDTEMEVDDHASLLDETKQELSDLQNQVLEMNDVIKTQTVLIRALTRKFQQKASVGPLPVEHHTELGLGSNLLLNVSHGAPGVRSRVQNGMTPPRTDSPDLMSTPVLCEDDLESLGNDDSEELHTLIDVGGPVRSSGINTGSDRDIHTRTPPVTARRTHGNTRSSADSSEHVFGPIENKRSSNLIPHVTDPANIRQPLTGIVVNGERSPSRSPRPTEHSAAASTRPRPSNFDFRAEAVVGRSKTEPIIRHPPHDLYLQNKRASSTEPFNVYSQQTQPALAVTVEPNIDRNRGGNLDYLSPQTVRLPELSSDRGSSRTDPLPGYFGANSQYRSPHDTARAPTEQSDMVPPSRAGGGPAKICPICDKDQSQLTQNEFEQHVEQCLVSSEANPGSPMEPRSPVMGGPVVEIRECPVCNQVFPPSVSQQVFQAHVDEHFPDEIEVLGANTHVNSPQ